MARYDFKSLSHQDFEELTRDLLQAEWGVAIEAFKSGRDQGIDLRYSRAGAGNLIIQCKHYASSSFSGLLSHLRNVELPKVQRLSPDRYIVVTSLGLTPADKDKVVAAMSPFVLAPSDVVGADDLNGLLARHSAVQRANFKLWLTNTEVIERILHNAEACQTQFEVDRIRRKLPVFVQSQAYPRAQQILNDQRIVIISGVPGIGKTTLAEMLLFAHLDDGYEPVVIQTDLAEGKRLFRADRKQIFYYDDFLGQTFLGDHRTYTGRNHDSALLAFMEMVRNTPDSRFVLTTREHILQQALQASERFQYSATQTYKCVLDLGDYSFGQRARILYNHLYFSDLPNAHKQAILEDDFFLDVIKHKHFNPRLIEWIASLTRLNSPPADKYRENISDLLDSPARLWSHAFSSQISDSARDLLLTLYSLGEWVDIADLEEAFEAVHKGACERYTRRRTARDFRSALQELDGGFLRYSSGHASFLNPSIRDFTAGVFCDTPTLALELIADSSRFKQLNNLWRLSQERGSEELKNSLVANSSTLRANAVRFVSSESVLRVPATSGWVYRATESGIEWRLDSVVEWCEAFEEEAFVDLARTFAEALLEHWKSNSVEFGSMTTVLSTMKDASWFLEHGGMAIYRLVLDGLLMRVNEAWSTDWTYLLELPELAIEWTNADEKLLSDGLTYYLATGIGYERDDCSDVSSLNELADSLRTLESKYSLGLGHTIEAIEVEIEEREDRLRHEDEDGGGYSRGSTPALVDPTTDEDVREMFRTLHI